MFTEDYLILRLVRLKPPEEWINNQGGLSFVLPTEGAGKCLCGPLNHRVASGDVLVLDGSVGGKLCAPDSGEMVFACFSVSFEHLFPLFAGNEISQLQRVTEDLKQTKLYPASSPLAVECHRLLREVPPQFSLDHRSQLLRVAAAILNVEFKNAHSQRGGFIRIEYHLIQVFEKLSASDLVGLTVPELADKFGCSRRHLNRLFHQYFGISVAALRMEMRLLKAMTLLRNPDAKIINVAENCGFNHLGLFNTCFKRRFGRSPGHWRKEAVPNQDHSAGSGGPAFNCPLRVNGLCPWVGQPDHPEAVPQQPSQTQKAVSVRAWMSAHAPNAGAKVPLTAAEQKLSKGASTRAFAANR